MSKFYELQEIGREREAWRAAVHGVAKSQTRFSDSTTTQCRIMKTERSAGVENSSPRANWKQHLELVKASVDVCS